MTSAKVAEIKNMKSGPDKVAAIRDYEVEHIAAVNRMQLEQLPDGSWTAKAEGGEVELIAMDSDPGGAILSCAESIPSDVRRKNFDAYHSV